MGALPTVGIVNNNIGQLNNNNRGSSSYFNKNGGPMSSANGNQGLPTLGSKGGYNQNTNGNVLGSYGSGNFPQNSAIGQNRIKPPGLQ